MTGNLTLLGLSVLLVFCRVGGCLMLLPGFANPHVPLPARLFLALGLSVAISPAVLPAVLPVLDTATPSQMILVFLAEAGKGIAIGLVGRVLFLALEFAATAVASFLNLSGMPGMMLEEADPSTVLTSLITITATVLMFTMDLHVEAVKGLLASYSAFGITAGFDVRAMLSNLLDAAGQGFTVALRIAAPFMVYAIVVNLLFGIANKLVPQVAVYFVVVPLVICGGLALLALATPDLFVTFMSLFSSWLSTGRL